MLDQTSHELDQLPEGSILRSVTAIPAEVAGRKALRIELTDDVTFNGKPGVDYIDKPTFVIIPASLTSGTIEVDVLSRLNNKGPADARAFAGLAYRIADGGDGFEAIYLRPLNGLKTSPPSPRDQRAVQYFAYPGHSTGYERSTRTADTKRPPTSARTSGSTSRSNSPKLASTWWSTALKS